MKKILVVISCVCFSLGAFAQQVNTLYFLENSPHRHYLNPALEPLSRMYFSITPLGYTSLSVGNNSLTMSDLVYNREGQTVTFLHPELGSKTDFLNNLQNATLLDADMQLNILALGCSTKKGYFHLTLNTRLEESTSLPKGLFAFVLDGGMHDLEGTNTFQMKELGVNVSAYSELAIGYMHNISDKFALGFKVKLLYGHAYVGMNHSEFDLNASSAEWNLRGVGTATVAAPITGMPNNLGGMLTADFDFPRLDNGNIDVMTMVKPQGLGGAIDLGFTYKPIEQIRIAASVTDLGIIKWFKGIQYDYTLDGTFEGIGNIDVDQFTDETGKLNQAAISDTVINRLSAIYSDAFHAEDAKNGFMKLTTARLNVGLDFNFWENRIGLGVYSSTKYMNSHLYEEVTVGAAFRPCHWFQLAASYSILNGKGSNIGAAFGFVTGEGIGLTLVADYVPCEYAPINGQLAIPYKTKGLNLGLGINIVVGHDKREKAKLEDDEE